MVYSQAAWPEMEYSEEGQGEQGLARPDTELLDPAAHSVHPASPAAVLYVPAAQGMHEGEFIPSLSYPASHHPDWKVSTALLSGSPVPVTARRVTQSEESLSGEGEATLLPWSLKSLGRVVGSGNEEGVMEKREMTTGCWNDIWIH